MREAAGYILFHDGDAGRRFLLLRNARHGTWSFPKGHLDPGEDLESGARRELREETGITRIREVPGFAHPMIYVVPARARPGAGSPYEKRVTLFLASADSDAWTRSPEHDAGDWMTAAEVRERLAHPDLREAFEAALGHLDAATDREPPVDPG